MKKTTITELRTVWGRVALGSAPTPAETKNTVELPKRRLRSDRTAQLNLRIRPDEKEQMLLMAVRERVSINEIFSRILSHYQQEHGRIELSTNTESDAT